MRCAELHKPAKIRNKYRACDVSFDIGTDLTRLPGPQSPASVWNRLRDFRINLPTQQRSRVNYGAVNCPLVIQLTHSCIKERKHMVHPLMRLRRADLWTRGSPANIHIHCQHLPPSSSVGSHPLTEVVKHRAIDRGHCTCVKRSCT